MEDVSTAGRWSTKWILSEMKPCFLLMSALWDPNGGQTVCFAQTDALEVEVL
jgi:hypothetical protein